LPIGSLHAQAKLALLLQAVVQFISCSFLSVTNPGTASYPMPTVTFAGPGAGADAPAQARQDFSRKLKWGPSDFSSEK